MATHTTSEQIGSRSWTRTNTERINSPPCYFDTTLECFLFRKVWLTREAFAIRLGLEPITTLHCRSFYGSLLIEIGARIWS